MYQDSFSLKTSTVSEVCERVMRTGMSQLLILALIVETSIGFVSACSENEQRTNAVKHPVESTQTITSSLPPTPTEFTMGEAKFNSFCAGCHGAQAGGTDKGPPLVHKIYEPSHHGDFAFQRAAAQGVRAHHWEFGNMPKIDGVTSADVSEIIKYVRWLQRKAKIY